MKTGQTANHHSTPRSSRRRAATLNIFQSDGRAHPKLKLAGVIAMVVVLFLAAYFLALEPSQKAAGYLSNLKTSNSQLDHTCFRRITATTEARVFNDPDTTPVESTRQLTRAESLVAHCQRQLANFDETVNQLQPASRIHLASAYAKARVEQRRAGNVVSQSSDVLKNYDQTLTYLLAYFGYAATFEQKTSEVNSVYYLDSLKDKTFLLYDDANTLKSIADTFQETAPADGYGQLRTAFPAVLRQAADGYEQLAYGLTVNSDSITNAGIHAIEQATQKYTSSVRILPAQLSQTAPALQNVMELPDKTIDFSS